MMTSCRVCGVGLFLRHGPAWFAHGRKREPVCVRCIEWAQRVRRALRARR